MPCISLALKQPSSERICPPTLESHSPCSGMSASVLFLSQTLAPCSQCNPNLPDGLRTHSMQAVQLGLANLRQLLELCDAGPGECSASRARQALWQVIDRFRHAASVHRLRWTPSSSAWEQEARAPSGGQFSQPFPIVQAIPDEKPTLTQAAANRR